VAKSRVGGDADSSGDDAVDVVEGVDGVDEWAGVDGVDEWGGLDEDELDLQWHDDDPEYDPESTGTESATPQDRFNAFDSSTWDIGPPTVPWYATKQAVATTAAASVALVVLVVSVVLLAVRGTPTADEPALVQSPSTVSSPASTAPVETVAVAPPPVPLPPPPPPVASPAPPAYVPVGVRPSTKPEKQPPPTANVSHSSFGTPTSRAPGR